MVRRKKKTMNIFSMSALDLFASAMGAFILLMLILMPYYENVVRDTKSKTPPECKPQTAKKPKCPLCPVIEPKVCPKILPPTERVEVKDNLLMATVEWYDTVDVDLVVYAPDNRKYYFGRQRYPGLDAYFIDDNFGKTPPNRGRPLLEVWKFYKPIQGDYKICSWLHVIHPEFPRNPGDVMFSLRLDKPTGVIEYRNQTFSTRGQEICPIKFNISKDYKFTRLP